MRWKLSGYSIAVEIKWLLYAVEIKWLLYACGN